MNKHPHITPELRAITMVYMSLIITCIVLVLGFFAGMYLYEPIWPILMWPEIQTLSILGWDDYLHITEMMLGRLPLNRTSMGALLGVLFWWPIVTFMVKVITTSEILLRVTIKYFVIFIALSVPVLILLINTVTPRGCLSIVAEGILLYLFSRVNTVYGVYYQKQT